MRHWIFALSVLVGSGLVGCTKAKPTPTASTNPPAGAAVAAQAKPKPQPIAVPANATPEQVMTVFLQAWQKGDSATFDSLLTDKAREELAKHDVTPDPLSSPNAVFNVEPARPLATDPTVVNVNSVWTEQVQNEEGKLIDERYQIEWALRRQQNGWRVVGMRMELVPGQVQQISFEDPATMLRMMADATAALNPSAPAQPGAAQPGAIQAGAVQPGAVQPGLQPGAIPASVPAAQTAQQPQFPSGQAIPQRIER